MQNNQGKEFILSLLKEQNPKIKDYIDKNLIKISDPVDIPYMENDKVNTLIFIKSNSDQLIGGKTFKYYRQPLDKFFNGIPIQFDFNLVKTHEDIIDFINKKYGTSFDVNEFNTVEIQGGMTSFILSAKSTNYLYTGGVDVHHAFDLNDLDELQIEHVDVVKQPKGKLNGNLYSRLYNFSDVAYFKNLVENKELYDTVELANLLRLKTNDNWINLSTPSAFNTFGAVVESVSETFKLGNRYFKEIKIKLDTKLCTNFYKSLSFIVFVSDNKVKQPSVNVDKLLNKITNTDFSDYKESLMKLVKGNLGQAGNILINQLFSNQLPSKKFTVLYNGSSDRLPEVYEDYVVFDTSRIAILSLSDDVNKRFALHY